ncbi:sensor histidine kinase [Variovorax sp. OV329]|uniref:sensor histidine kinase n=1 Tax=Variovorax sp. OV329 TaxID=1882825 RepID=UPI0008EB4144|nr:histidine kinase [Variovorax sp. OV329]SFN49353.1 Histidine kinase-, DNA gyrase B-, and HSP90-like ATPase [Variovorax sp. OV329]
MKIVWRDVLRHGLLVVAFCFAIAAVINSIWPNKSYLHHLGYSFCIGLLIWLVIEFGRYPLRRPEDPGGWPHGWRGGLLTVVGIVLGYYAGSALGDLLIGGGSGAIGMGESQHDQRVSLAITVLAGALGSYFFYSRGHNSALAARVSAAERDATEARLKLLETQLEPHMLFNTLANLRVLIATDPPRAVDMLDRLNNYLRATLSGSRVLAHPLSAEFERLGDYLSLMSVRMGERLRFRLELPPALAAVQVPPLILQPLVENSIRHGLEPKVEGGDVVVTARAGEDGTLLVIEVSDTGVGIDEAQARAIAVDTNGSFGLGHIRERLATVYGARGTLEFGALPGGGTRATLHIPLNT